MAIDSRAWTTTASPQASVPGNSEEESFMEEPHVGEGCAEQEVEPDCSGVLLLDVFGGIRSPRRACEVPDVEVENLTSSRTTTQPRKRRE